MILGQSSIRYLLLIMQAHHLGEPIRMIDISKKLHVSKATVSLKLKRMMVAGFLLFEEKSKSLQLTETGLKLGKDVCKSIEVLHEKLLATFSIGDDDSYEWSIALLGSLRFEEALEVLLK